MSFNVQFRKLIQVLVKDINFLSDLEYYKM